MSNDNVLELVQPGAFEDQLTEILWKGARWWLKPYQLRSRIFSPSTLI